MSKSNEVRVLIVDDVEVNLIILEEIIKNMGYHPLTAQSVKEALQIIQDSNPLPRVILSDISMPDIDGFTFCSMLKKDPYTKDIPVIFISAITYQSRLTRQRSRCE
jgi:putative two-component system response regulator